MFYSAILPILDLQQPIFQLLMYPALNLSCSSWSYQEYASGYFLTTENVKRYVKDYIKDDDSLQDPLISPGLQTDVAYLPRTHIITAEYDPLRGEAEAYLKHLMQSDVPVTHHCYKGMIHAFLHMSHSVPAAKTALYEISTVVQEALNGPLNKPSF